MLVGQYPIPHYQCRSNPRIKNGKPCNIVVHEIIDLYAVLFPDVNLKFGTYDGYAASRQQPQQKQEDPNIISAWFPSEVESRRGHLSLSPSSDAAEGNSSGEISRKSPDRSPPPTLSVHGSKLQQLQRYEESRIDVSQLPNPSPVKPSSSWEAMTPSKLLVLPKQPSSVSNMTTPVAKSKLVS